MFRGGGGGQQPSSLLLLQLQPLVSVGAQRAEETNVAHIHVKVTLWSQRSRSYSQQRDSTWGKKCVWRVVCSVHSENSAATPGSYHCTSVVWLVHVPGRAWPALTFHRMTSPLRAHVLAPKIHTYKHIVFVKWVLIIMNRGRGKQCGPVGASGLMSRI